MQKNIFTTAFDLAINCSQYPSNHLPEINEDMNITKCSYNNLRIIINCNNLKIELTQTTRILSYTTRIVITQVNEIMYDAKIKTFIANRFKVNIFKDGDWIKIFQDIDDKIELYQP